MRKISYSLLFFAFSLKFQMAQSQNLNVVNYVNRSIQNTSLQSPTDANNTLGSAALYSPSFGSSIFLSNEDGSPLQSLKNSSNRLPLTLLDFSACLIKTDGALNWKTASEQTTSSFEIERSTNGRIFFAIGTAAVARKSISENYYGFTDWDIASSGASVIYYRLKMKDTDGKFTYSKKVVLHTNRKGSIVLLYPNPIKERATVMISVAKPEEVNYTIVNQGGRMVETKTVDLQQGSNIVTIDLKALPAGVYSLQVKGTITKRVIQFVKQ